MPPPRTYGRMLRRDPGQRGLHGIQCGLRLVTFGTTALRHVRATAAALAAQRFDACTDEIDSADVAHQIIGHAYGDAGAAFDHRKDGGYAAAKGRLVLIDQAAPASP